MRLLCLAIAVTAGSLFAQEAIKSKTEMKKDLDNYVVENQEASASIKPLIDRVRAILSDRKTEKAEERPVGKKVKE